MEPNPLVDISDFALNTRFEDLPPAIVHETKRVLMDSLGCMLGAQTIDKGKEYLALSRRLGGQPEATILGSGDKVSLSTAALVNGELMFTLDFHNIMANSHDGAYVIPTVLAFAESAGSSGRELICATALGCEISSRLARAILRHPAGAASQAPKPQGRLRTGNAHSNFGAAAGAARLLKMDREKTLNALGIAGHLCMVLTYGRWGVRGHNYMMKYGAPGWQSTGAVTAALLAEMGYTGDQLILDKENGFGYICGYSYWYPELIAEELGKTWWFNYRLHYKPYPCCGVFHTALDCFYEIREKERLLPQEIESIKVYLRGFMGSHPLTPQELENISAAQFSGHYVFSVAAHGVPRGPEWHDKSTVRNPSILSLMDKVSIYRHPDYEKSLVDDPLSALSKCEVSARGRVFSVEKVHRKGTLGTAEAPSDEEITRKFRHNAERVLTQDKIERAVNLLTDLEDLDNIALLIHELCG
jgi:2-methylcitrate dehydratase PrpD